MSLQRAGGIEQPSNFQGKPHVSTNPKQNPKHSDALPNDQAPTDSRLKLVLDRWQTLSEDVQNRIAEIAGDAI